MTDTEALRDAIESALAIDGSIPVDLDEREKAILVAAISWLALAEGDEAVVEKVAVVLHKANALEWPPLPFGEEDMLIYWREQVRAVLAAITEEGE